MAPPSSAAGDGEICKEGEVGWDDTTGDGTDEGVGPPFCRLRSSSPAAAVDCVVVVSVRMATVSVTLTEMFLDVDWMSGCCTVSSTDSHWPVPSPGTSRLLARDSSGPGLAADVSLSASVFDVVPVSRTLMSDGLMTIRLRYHSRLSSSSSRISWQSGCTRSAHVSHNGCTM